MGPLQGLNVWSALLKDHYNATDAHVLGLLVACISMTLQRHSLIGAQEPVLI